MIKIDPNKVEEYAQEIEDLGGKMKSKMAELDAKVKSLRADWQDDAMNNYDQSFTKLQNEFDSLAAAIPQFAEEARQHAQAMRKIGQG